MNSLVCVNEFELMKFESIPSEMLTYSNVAISSVSTSTPPDKYRQRDIPDLFSFSHPTVRKFFEYEHIQFRYLYLPPKDPVTNVPLEESHGDLLKKFESGAVEVGKKAFLQCLHNENLKTNQVDYLCCVTSTGFVIPGLSAIFIRELGLRNDCQRIDIVGMGCNAGLNGLNAVSAWSAINPNKNAILLCVEICSAIYSIDDTPRTAIVNSLFGDGAAACLVRNGGRKSDSKIRKPIPRVLGFESQLIPESWKELHFDWDDQKHRYSFYVGKNTPKATAAMADQPLSRILRRFDLKKNDINHWLVHGGGNAILLGMKNKLDLTEYDLRHTRSVLRDFGNVSSGSFLFSYSRLVEEDSAKIGDYGIMMTMGPGLTIEMALLRWE